MSRRPLVAGNWKLNLTRADGVALARAVADGVGGAAAEVVVAPTFPSLAAVAEAVDGTPVAVSAQDVYWETEGAFTGEVSAPLLADAGCRFGIVGHSERRQLFGETDESVARKRAALRAAGLVPIVCVGETLEQREAGETEAVVLGQVRAAIADVAPGDAANHVIAYEPVWAIGTGRTASPDDAQAVHAAIRGTLEDALGTEAAAAIRLLYGGSVKPANAAELFGQADIDGGLVGGASLKADSFVAIVRAAG